MRLYHNIKHMVNHYYSKEQTSPAKNKTITIVLGEDRFELTSADGLFSKDELDFGTRLLIASTHVQDGMRVLDLGCGYGVVGIALLRKYGKMHVVFSDVNARAVAIAQANIALQKLSLRADVRQSDLFEHVPEKFDAILLNPPYAAGRNICYAMIEQSRAHLHENGFLEVVARHNKGGAMLENKMQEVFGNVKTQAKQGGFRVYVSKKKNVKNKEGKKVL